MENMFFNKKLLSHENVLRAATARSEEQGVDGGQGVADDPGRRGDTIHRVSQQCQVATRKSPGAQRGALDSPTGIHGKRLQ